MARPQKAAAVPPRKLFKLASSAFAKKKHDVALSYCNQLLTAQPDHAGALGMKGRLLIMLGDLANAFQHLNRAAMLEPANAEHYLYLARIFSDQGKANEAVGMLDKARSLAPKNLEIHAELAATFMKFNHVHLVPEQLEKVFAEVGEDSQLLQLYCLALQENDRDDEAHEAYQKLLKKHRPPATFRMMFELRLPRLLYSREQINETRERFADSIEKFMQEKPQVDLSKLTYLPTFNLAFQNQDNKELASNYCKMLRLCAKDVGYVAPHVQGGSKAVADKTPIKIGFASRYMHNHSVGRCYRNLLSALHQHGGFEVSLFVLGNVIDETLTTLQAEGVKIVNTHKDLATTQKIIAQRELDILIFPDIGMEPMSYYLAMSKLAHYQCCLTGHPDTTGIDTLDYFISAGAYEAPKEQENYTETLLRAPGIDTVFTKFKAPQKWLSRAEFDLPEDKKIYLVPMAIQKLHPDFDDVLAGILAKDPEALIVMFNDFQLRSASTTLQDRLLAKCDASRVRFLDWQPLDHLISLMKLADSVLSTIYFGAGTTSQIAFSFGIPLVSWPDWHARSRMVHGYYQFMGVENPPSANSIEDYVNVAVKVANDLEYREDISQQILQKHEILYEDNGYKQGFAQMMQAILAQQLEAYQ